MEKTKRQFKEEKDSLLSAMEDLKLQTERKLHQLQDTHSRALQRMDDNHERCVFDTQNRQGSWFYFIVKKKRSLPTQKRESKG